MQNPEQLIRTNILQLKPYSSAREEYSGDASVFLDANENPFPTPYNRYPDPLQKELKEMVSKLKRLPAEQIFLGNGSDEAIDLLFRIFCEPGRDNAILHNPTYGMYQVCADIQDVEIKKVSLLNDYRLDVEGMLSAADENSKLLFICNPNNPTGNSFDKADILRIINEFQGIVVIDEAYIDFASHEGFRSELKNHQSLVLLHTFSKAWGLAGVRLGMAFAHEKIIQFFNKVKYPYNLNVLAQQLALEKLPDVLSKEKMVTEILQQREVVKNKLLELPLTLKIYPTDTNFLLVKMKNARAVYQYLTDEKIIVRDRSNVHLCDDCLRITIGTEKENEKLIESLLTYS
ncbi:MAG: histidinol-phosphate transaminase [Bacteroidetes bacterium]|jgi:histidinol-phosphate aminotransferase|nr:histidinol-phosphate transaminase [Bacteroidota bacterium]